MTEWLEFKELRVNFHGLCCSWHNLEKNIVLWGCADWSQHCLQDIYKLLNNIWKVHISIVCLGFFAPIREFFSHFETPLLPVKDCNFLHFYSHQHYRVFRFFSSWFFVLLENFHSYGDVTITGERLQILIYARHLWPLSSEGSFAYHTYCDTGYPFIMVISEDPWQSHLLPSVCWHSHLLPIVC